MDLPVPSPTKPFWHQDGHRLSGHRSTEEIPTSQDVVVIGAGFTGASCAYFLSHAPQAPARITVLEAREACSGATGRNGGHMRPESLATFAKFADKININTADEIAQFGIANLRAVQELVQELNIDCDFEQIQSANAYLDENLAEAAKAQQRQLADAGFDVVKRFKYHDETTAPAVTGVRDAKGAMTFPAACLWPYKFVMHLLSASVAKGVNLQAHTPVLDVSTSPDSDGYWTVNTPRGATKAKKFIFATNGYTRRLVPEYSGHIIPVRGICSHIVADTTPAPALAPATRTMGVKHSPGCQDYLISRPDGSIVVGGAWKVVRPGPRDDWHDVTDDSKLIPAAETYYDGFMRRTFESWGKSDEKVDSLWTGIMGYTADSLPHVGQLGEEKPGQYLCAGFNGHGMPQVLLGAKGVVKILLESCDFADTGVPAVFQTSAGRRSK